MPTTRIWTLTRRLQWLSFIMVHLWAVASSTAIVNPCTRDAMLQKLFYHPYPSDSGSYIQCTEWGTPITRRCPSLQIWSVEYMTCVDGSWRSGGTYNDNTFAQKHGGNSPTAVSERIAQQPGVNDALRGQIPTSGGNNFSWQTYFVVGNRPPTSYQQNTQQQLQQQFQHQEKGEIQQPSQFSGQLSDYYQSILQQQQQQLSVTTTVPTSSSVIQSIGNSGSASGQETSLISNSGQLFLPPYGKSIWLSKMLFGSSQANPGVSSNANPCSVPNTRYIPHPSNPNFYYECIGLQAAERMCPSDQAWSQEGGQCIGATFTESVSLCSGQQFSTGNAVTIPYPGDLSRYVICFDASRFEIGQCPAGQLWTGYGQQCASASTPQSASDGSSGGVADVCVPTSSSSVVASYYHSYPPDHSRFLQCDEFGNVYLRYCGPNKLWKDEYKTCVGGSNITVGDMSGQSGAASGSSSTGLSSSSSLPHNENTARSVQNPGYSGGLANTGSDSFSQSTAQFGGNSETIIVAEIFRIVCPNGYQYSIDTGVCKHRGHPAVESGMSCPPGFDWNAQLYLCVQKFSVGTQGGMGAGSSNSSTGMGSPGGSTSLGGGNSTSTSHGSATGVSSTGIPSLPAGSNPCGRVNIGGGGSAFYFPFPGSTGFFIQCDATGSAFIQACPTGLVWNQDLVTCVRGSPPNNVYQIPLFNGTGLADENSTQQSVNGSNGTLLNDLLSSAAVNPCSLPTSNGKYFPDDTNPLAYIQCDNGVPKVRYCSTGMVWNQSIQTCSWANAVNRP